MQQRALGSKGVFVFYVPVQIGEEQDYCRCHVVLVANSKLRSK